MTKKQRQFFRDYLSAANRMERIVLLRRAQEDPELVRFRGLPR